MAQSGSALAWGARGRRFESFHSDQKFNSPVIFDRAVFFALTVSNLISQAFQSKGRLKTELHPKSWTKTFGVQFKDDAPFLVGLHNGRLKYGKVL